MALVAVALLVGRLLLTAVRTGPVSQAARGVASSTVAPGATEARSPTEPPPAASATDRFFTASGRIIDHGRRDLPMVALTFDSNLTRSMITELDRGTVPSFDNTEVVDELQSLDVPATFFLAGLWMERYPDEVRRLAADPRFELASHSYAHVGFAPACYHLGLLPIDQMAADVEHSEELLRRASPGATPYFRFPGGCANPAAVEAIGPAGVTVIGYDVAGGDAFGHSVSAIVHNVVGTARNGSIVVLHVTGGNTAPLTAKALPDVVRGLRQRGFQLVRVSTLLAACAADGCPD